MPSWNIHTAHVERLLERESLDKLGIADANAFLFGNLVPDIYVGYMVPDVTSKRAYRDTHFADPGFIPAPDASLFYRLYVQSTNVSDLTLGAWCHLLCDHYYNLRTTQYIASIGVAPGEQTRIRKQGDFDLFGRTLGIRLVPKETPSLLRLCAAFPQYPIEERDARASIEVASSIVERNRARHVDGVPAYNLLTSDFFARTFEETDNVLREALCAHARGEDSTRWGSFDSCGGGSCLGT